MISTVMDRWSSFLKNIPLALWGLLHWSCRVFWTLGVMPPSLCVTNIYQNRYGSHLMTHYNQCLESNLYYKNVISNSHDDWLLSQCHVDLCNCGNRGPKFDGSHGRWYVAFPMIMSIVFSMLEWICGTVEQWKRGLKVSWLTGLMICNFPNEYESCLLNSSVGLWNCGTVETGA